MTTFFVGLLSATLFAGGPAEIKNQRIATSVCKLALENIELLRVSEVPEPWFRYTTAMFTFTSTPLYVDRLSSLEPVLNNKYFEGKTQILSDLYSYSKAKMKTDLSYYIIARTPPKNEETLMDYISEVVKLYIETFHSTKSDLETATLNSINQLLNTMSLRDPESISLLLAELEVKFPDEFVDLKNSSELHSLFNLKEEMVRIKKEFERIQKGLNAPVPEELIAKKISAINAFHVQRTVLFNRLIKEEKIEELYAAQAMFGTEP